MFVFVGLYLGNTSWLATTQADEMQLLAHRGLHQTFSPVSLNTTDCTASMIDKPVHRYLENTIASVQAALNLGADIVEIDIHPTRDGEFVVFHDWELSCRTNGEGVVRQQHSEYLKTLDVGYGYTFDGGLSFPFRGEYVGAMPTLGELLTHFPDTKFLVNIKGNEVEEADLLTSYLNSNPSSNRKRLSVYGNGVSIPRFADLNPDMVTFSKRSTASCLKRYVLLGWSGYVPDSCRNSFISVPQNYRWLIWGWPNRFEKRLSKVGSKPMLIGSHRKGKANSGIDSKSEIPEHFGGIVLTNRIDLTGRFAGSSFLSEYSAQH